jgi:hypothetical protein
MRNRAPRDEPQIEQLLEVPGLVGDLATWINNSSIKPQPILALGASIAAMATIVGRKVQTQTGLRTNLYVLGVGHTGCGKERARQCIKLLFEEIGHGGMIGGSFASDSSVETAVSDSPACLYLVDEIGLFLETCKSENAAAYVKGIIKVWLEMYGASESTYRKRTYTDKDRNKDNTIDQPCLNIYGTTVPQNLFSSLTKEHLSDGFLSRMLVFQSRDPDPFTNIIDKATRAVPGELAERFRRWAGEPINPGADGNLARLRPDPLEVTATPEAWNVFTGLENRMRDMRADCRRKGECQGPYTRVWATAQKLALIRACGISEAPEITVDDARWGCDLAWALTRDFLDQVSRNVAENKTEATYNRMLGIIREAGPEGMSKNAFAMAAKWATRKERDATIESLQEAGQVIVAQIKGKGRPATRLVAVL